MVDPAGVVILSASWQPDGLGLPFRTWAIIRFPRHPHLLPQWTLEERAQPHVSRRGSRQVLAAIPPRRQL